jgi:hypothetical protein
MRATHKILGIHASTFGMHRDRAARAAKQRSSVATSLTTERKEQS